MWCTVVECLLQSDPRNVMVAVDLENCFNAIDRDALVDELRRHSGLRALARYVVAAYPPGMVSTTRIEGEWRLGLIGLCSWSVRLCRFIMPGLCRPIQMSGVQRLQRLYFGRKQRHNFGIIMLKHNPISPS